MTDKILTVELLGRLGAWSAVVEYFKRTHGEAAPLREVLWRADIPAEYAAWLGQCVPARFLDWESRLSLQRYDEDRAMLGWRCPAGVDGATWEARLAVQRSGFDRAMLGWHCPAGVPGATWEARLAVQRDDEDRAALARRCPAGVDGATPDVRRAVLFK